jgi:DNA replicative helicase MCM subunit Mcm2 (Cdc46/Mcm family)
VAGVVTRRTGVYPQMAILWYTCRACGGSIGPLTQSGDATADVKPASCPNCEGRGPFVIDQQQTVYRNYQKITLQVRAGASLHRETARGTCRWPRTRAPAPRECGWEVDDVERGRSEAVS